MKIKTKIAQEVTPQIVRRNALIWVYDYLINDPVKSVNGNNHMNGFGNSIENIALGTTNPTVHRTTKGTVFKADPNNNTPPNPS